MAKDKERLHKLSEVIDKYFEKRNYTQKRENFNAFHNWDQIVGKDIAKNTIPIKFHNDILVIKVKNSVWTQELQFLKPQLLDKIRNSFPETKIKDLLFRVGSFEK